MPLPVNEKLIFGRYTREDCGLPEAGMSIPDGGISFWRGLALFIGLVAVGWFAGQVTARYREEWVARLPLMVHLADVNQIPDLLQRGKAYATALPEKPRIRRDLAFAVMTAADKSPRRIGYLANAANLFRGMDARTLSPGLECFHYHITASGAYGDLGEFHEAFVALDRAEKCLADIQDEIERRSYRLILVNAKAYYLAIAPAHQGGNPEQALRLAVLAVSSRDRLPGGGFASDSGAFLDTLATARAKTGDHAGALQAQGMALGLAASNDLAVYLMHYDAFNQDATTGIKATDAETAADNAKNIDPDRNISE